MACCTKEDYERFFRSQAGNGMQFYHGGYQKGHGIGSLFKSLGRALLPMVSRGAKAIGKQALETGAMVAQDVLSGHSFKDSIKARGKEAGSSLLNQVLTPSAPAAPSAAPPQGIKRKRPRQGGQKRGKRARRQRDIFN